MEKIEDIKSYILDCEKSLQQLKDKRTNKDVLMGYHNKLRKMRAFLRQERGESDNQEIAIIIKDIDDLLFIIDSLIDYYTEEVTEELS